MDKEIKSILLRATGATRLLGSELIQELWSGYCQILRCRLGGAERSSVVVKHVRLPEQASHPRGWNTDLSHQRKLRSYQVEIEWYRRWSERCTAACRVPECLALESRGDETLITAGSALPFYRAQQQRGQACLSDIRRTRGHSPSGSVPRNLRFCPHFDLSPLPQFPLDQDKSGTQPSLYHPP